MHFISGIVFVQYGEFCSRQASRKSRLLFRLGTIGIILHLFQMIVDLVTMTQSFQLYASGGSYTYFLYEALQIFLSTGIILIVQCHFSRLACTTAGLSKKWTCTIGILTIATFVGGFATALAFEKHFELTGLHMSTPLVVYNELLAFNLAWLGLNGLTDGTITWVMVRALHQSRSSMRHKSLRTTLHRLLLITINTFALTSLTVILSLIMTMIPHVTTSLSLMGQIICQTTGFILNGLLVRIYLVSFFCSFQKSSCFARKKFDSCVASLTSGNTGSSWSNPLGLGQVEVKTRHCSERQSFRARLHVTREVEIVFDQTTKQGSSTLVL